MRLDSSEASELVELSTKLPPIRDVGDASDFKEKEVMHVRQLTRVNATSRAARVRENVTGRSSKPLTIVPNASNRGLLFRWGSFGPQELTRFRKLLEKPVKLKPGWPDNKDMTT
ncbi:hypothetical protein J1N35_021822 [Gossypium stocksii]|uniref:Uncharacterized protein n=1 Tax=Gossypium stocksii TaxID=47602 RepID=A0A9D3VF87_9ROSI|nr:hypothetical protein J1N35_021822 [Gossypium stocksii]